jgi:hypothetical protein
MWESRKLPGLKQEASKQLEAFLLVQRQKFSIIQALLSAAILVNAKQRKHKRKG